MVIEDWVFDESACRNANTKNHWALPCLGKCMFPNAAKKMVNARGSYATKLVNSKPMKNA